MLATAFKEWAAICAALAQGQQSLILRKGGVAEESGEFRPDEPRFWLLPTWTHQQQTGIRPDAIDLLREVESNRPFEGTLRLTHWAEATSVYHVRDELRALLLGHLHVWSDDTVRQRFRYRSPGLYVLVVRVYQGPEPFEAPDTPEYQGCKSWVRLDHALPTAGSKPVSSDKGFENVTRQVELLLAPTALA